MQNVWKLLVRQRIWFLGVGMLLAAGALNLPHPKGFGLYNSDELFRDLDVIHAMQKGNFPQLGPPSMLGDFHFGPAYYYILFPFVVFLHFTWNSLAWASLTLLLATSFLSWLISFRWWRSTAPAFLIVGLMAVSIQTFELAQYGSNPNFIPFFVLLFFYAFERLLAGECWWKWVVLLAASFAITIQLHAVPMVALPIVLLVAVLRRDLKLSMRQWLLFFSMSILLCSPYIFYELGHHFLNTTTLLHISGGNTNYAPLWSRAVEYVGYWLFSFISLHPTFNILDFSGLWFPYILAGALVLGYIIFSVELRRPRTKLVTANRLEPSVATTLWYWLLVPAAILIIPVGALAGMRYYYYLMLYPLVFFLLGAGICRLWQKQYYWLLSYAGICFLLLEIFQRYEYRQAVIIFSPHK